MLYYEFKAGDIAFSQPQNHLRTNVNSQSLLTFHPLCLSYYQESFMKTASVRAPKILTYGALAARKILVRYMHALYVVLEIKAKKKNI